MDTNFRNTRKKLLKRLTYKYRLKILNESTFEEVGSFRLSQMNIFVFLGILSIILVFLTTYIIAFTPLREYIPGYADVSIKRKAVTLKMRADSLEDQMLFKDYYIQNIRNVIQGKPTIGNIKVFKDSSRNYKRIVDVRSKEDSLLRKEVEEAERFKISKKDPKNSVGGLFFTPVRGVIRSKYNPAKNMNGTDISAAQGEAVLSVADGSVIYAGWSPETGSSILIQHSGNFISLYQNNEQVLKKPGAFVKAGEAVALVGSSPDKKHESYLHFELWLNGAPVNPADYITL